MEHHKKYLQTLIAKGGPNPSDYYDLDAWIIEFSENAKIGQISEEERDGIIKLFGDAFSTETMQGFAFQKPHGYAGDYEIIDRIYQSYVSSQKHLTNWDVYWQSHAAADAVRNRVHYLHRLVLEIEKKAKKDSVHILNLASGPGRDMFHFFRNYDKSNVYFDCVEQDINAIEHAKQVCTEYLSHINFYNQNALRFNSKTKYDLIWSAGLFDYFEDKIFIFMLKRLSAMLADNGEIVIGNFSTKNPSKPYMELFEWNLHHRSPQTLMALAHEAGLDPEFAKVEKEESGVNLFLHYQNKK